VEVVDPIWLSPLDRDLIVQSVSKTGRLVTVHEAPTPFGVGAEIAALAAERCLDYLEAPVKRVGGAFTPVPYSPVLEDLYLPNAKTVEQAIREVMK